MKLDICICTHNPRADIFRLVLQALARQTLSREDYHVWVIDNGSQPPLSKQALAPLAEGNASWSLVEEPQLGQVFARATAIEAGLAEWMVFVDDDTVLAPDYLQGVSEIAEANPQLGCFGGKLRLPSSIPVPKWAKEMLLYLAIKDCGEEPITRCANEWGPWEPPGAGAAVRRPLLELYMKRLRAFPELGRLGRKGMSGLFSCDDSLMMRGAFALGLSSSYQPRLTLDHYLSPHRFRFLYLARLLYSLGRSHVILERTLGQTVPPTPRSYAWKLLRKIPLKRAKFCQRAYQWGHFLESRREHPAGAKIS